MPPLFLVLISKKGGWFVHSVHVLEEVAKSWAKCKEHDGEDTAIATLPSNVVEDIESIIQNKT